MPYRVVDKTVQVRKGGRWENVKSHKNEKDAQKHLMALQANVEHKEK